MTKIHYALFNAKPDTEPPFDIEIFVDNQKIMLSDCKHIPDGIDKIKEYCNQNKVEFSQNFTLLYPIFLEIMNTDYENTMHSIAWLIKNAADQNKWNFNRIGGYTGLSTKNFENK